MGNDKNSGTLDCYVPRVVLRRLAEGSDDRVVTLDGTVVFVDVSGFTKLSERLARIGKEGAEQLVGVINSCFSDLLGDAYAYGGSLLKFGGDALLLWFEGNGHTARGCACALEMRSTLRRVGRIETGGRRIVLRMSVGVHSGPYEMFLVGESHREHVIAGPSATTVVAMEAAASAGQILISPTTAAELPPNCLGDTLGPGILLARAPSNVPPAPVVRPARPPDDAIAGCLSTVLRAHVLASGTAAVPEHRTTTMSFIQFGGFDELIEGSGAETAAQALHELVCIVQDATDRYQVCFLDSDIAADGGKLLLSAGAPRAFGDDEERMLLAARQVIDAKPSLPVRIGVNRGQTFTGEIGPPYRRTYVSMGDTTNLAARLSAKAEWGSIYVTGGVIDRSRTPFAKTELPPFMVKGKARAIEAWKLGPALRAALPTKGRQRLPLIGRQRELEALRNAIAAASSGTGSLIEIVGETGSGKSRLLAEARDLGAQMRFVHTTCEAYTRNVPYAAWGDPLRQLLGLTWDDPPDIVAERLHQELRANQPELLPWLPLLAIVLDVPAESTPEVDELAPDYRSAKLHEVVVRFLRPALTIPTLVQIEHAHLMDEASGALLHALAEALDDSNWVAIVTRRDTEDGFVAADHASDRLEMAPLTREESMILAEATPEADSVPPHLLELAVDRCGGSPEFLLDLLAAAAGGSRTLPEGMESAVAARIDALDPDDRALVRRASVLGLFFHPERLRDVLGPDAPDVDESTWERLATVFAHDEDGHIRFKRPALQEVAYAGLPFGLRRELHAAVAHSLERAVGEGAEADPAVLSMHYIIARDYERAWNYAREGARRAGERFAHADAARLYRRAIEAGRADGATDAEIADCWEALGEMLRRAGEPKAAGEALSTARRLVAEDAFSAARLLSKHAQIAERSGRLTAAVRWANRGIAELEGLHGEDAARLRARLTATLAAIRGVQGRHGEAEALARRAIIEADGVGELPAAAHACRVLDTALVDAGRAEEATYSARALEIYEQLGDLENQAAVLNNLGMFAYFRWQWDEATEFYRRAGDCAERAGRSEQVAYTDCNIGEILSDQGHFDDAEIFLKRARRIWRATGNRGAAFTEILLGRLAIRAARYEEGLALLESGAKGLGELGVEGYAANARLMLAEGEAFGGNPTRALEITGKLRNASDSYVPLPLLRRVRGVALARLGQMTKALEELEKSLSSARDRDMHYEVAATIDVLEALGHASRAHAVERDAILARLGVTHLPRPELGSPAAEPISAVAAI